MYIVYESCGQPMEKSVFLPPRRIRYEFTDLGRIEGLVDLSGKSE